MSQLSSFASKSSRSLNTRSRRIAPFARSSNNANAAIGNTIFFTSHCACVYIHPYSCKHGGCVVVHKCVSDVHITLMTNCFEQFPSITSKCRQRNNSCRNVRTPAMKLTWGTAHFHGHFTFHTSERERGTPRFFLRTPRFCAYATFVHEAPARTAPCLRVFILYALVSNPRVILVQP